jgi:type VI secretion system (T6SS) phospholipase Tle1-like effector
MSYQSFHAETTHSPYGRCIGVFDTVGSLGLPEELSFGSKKIQTLFGFPDSTLGDHVERAYQALALNETRADFVRTFLSHDFSPAHSNSCLEQQQVPFFRRGKKEKSSFEAGTINVTTMHCKFLTRICTQCWFAGECKRYSLARGY